MPAICFYFQVHQPYRLRDYTFFDLGQDHMYEADDANRSALARATSRCYLPMNSLLLKLIKEYKGEFKVSFSISGTALDQFERYNPEVIKSFKELAKTNCVEFLAETYNHSLASIYSIGDFAEQVEQHSKKIEKLFGKKPTTFRNTELIYINGLAPVVEEMGFTTILTEGADQILGWRSPNFVYEPNNCKKTKLLLKNYSLSDDIALRFPNKEWPEFPLSAEKFVSWANSANVVGDVINLFMYYETFGEDDWQENGIFRFMEDLPRCLLEDKKFCFMTPSEVTNSVDSVAKIDVPQYISWTDDERDLSAWLGNDLQLDAIEALYRLEPRVKKVNNKNLLKIWRNLQTSEHFYYMSTKWLVKNLKRRFNPYPSPYDAYINYMNILSDFELTLASKENGNGRKKK